MLALALAYGSGPLSLSLIAQRERISLGYLEQLVAALRRKGLVESIRGARGGYRLALPPGQVTLGDVLRAADEPIGPVDCVSDEQTSTCAQKADCGVRPAWVRLRSTMVGMLDSTTLADLCSASPTREGLHSNLLSNDQAGAIE